MKLGILLWFTAALFWGEINTASSIIEEPFEGEALFWKNSIPKRFHFVITNTITISNAEVIANVTNWKTSNVTTVYIFSDAFDELSEIDPVAQWEKEIAEMILPSDWYHFPVEESYLRWKRKTLKATSPQLIPTASLLHFSPELLESLRNEKRKSQGMALRGEQKPLAFRVEEWESEFVLSGWFVFRTGYGWTWKDPTFLQPIGDFQSGFSLSQNLRFNLTGKIGQRVNVSLSHQSDNPENTYSLQYKALDSDKGVVREVMIGNVAMQIPQKSSLLSMEGMPQQGVGVLGQFQFEKLTWQSLLHFSGTQKGYKRFIGSKQYRSVTIRDTQYLKRTYFVLPDQHIDNGSVEILIQTNVPADRQIDGNFYKRLLPMQDYNINTSSGELVLQFSPPREKRLIIRYTHSGLPFSNPAGPSWQGTDDNTGETFLYLWREDEPHAPYMHYGVYAIGAKNFDPGRGFDVRIVFTANPAQEAPFQFTSQDYLVFPTTGTVKFFKRMPIPGNPSLYTNYSDPSDSASLYSLVFTYYESVPLFQLDYNIIPQSESVYINGRKLSSWEYILIPSTGELILNQISTLQENDVIEVYYEYKPFYGSGVQKFTWANRWDYPILPEWNIGGTLLASLAQRGEEGARLPQTPNGIILAGIDQTFDIGQMLGWSKQNRWTLQMEGAVSLYDPNTANMGIVEDFETAGENFSLSRSEYRWILAAVLTNIPGITTTNRARLIYRDYRQYSGDENGTLIPYYATPYAVYPYNDKPGPYTALGGHLPASDYPGVVQYVLVWDYDFTTGEWIGTSSPLASGLRIDLSAYDEIVFWAKIENDDDGDGNFSENTSHQLDFYLAVGNLPEDSDGDGILDRETSVQDTGFLFNHPTDNALNTWVGKGRFGKGDGFIQTEDLNGNGNLDTTGKWVLLPSSGVSSPANIRLEGSGWKEYHIRIDQLSSDQLQALQQATAVAIYLKRVNGTKGRVLIDGITFQKTKWQRMSIDGYNITTAPQWKTSILTTFANAQYAKYRFYDPWSSDANAQERYTTFEQLHKMRSKAEVLQYEEKSLSLSYSLSNIPYNPSLQEGGLQAMVWQQFNTPLPIGAYESLSFYLFVPSSREDGTPQKKSPDTWDNESFVLVIGSSTNDFYTWEIPLQSLAKDQWYKATLSLSHLDLSIGNTVYKPLRNGSPYLYQTRTIGMGIRCDATEPYNEGTVWVNEIHVSNDKTTTGWASLTTTTIDWRKPLWIYNGTEILGPLLLMARSEWRNSLFQSSLNNTNTLNNADTLLHSMDIRSSLFRLFDYQLYGSWLRQATTTNEAELPLDNQSRYIRNNGGFTIRYKNTQWIPDIFHSYSEKLQWRQFYISATPQQTIVQSAATKYTLQEKLPWNRSFSHQISSSYEHNATLDVGEYTSSLSRISNRSHNLNRAKIFSLSVMQTTGPLTISANYNKNQQKYRRYDLESPLDPAGTIFRENGNSAGRYIFAQQGLIEGFDWNDPFWAKDNENFGLSFNLDKPFPWLYAENKNRWARQRESFSYAANNSLLSFQTTHTLTNQWNINLYPRLFFLDTLGISLQRQSRLWYQTNNDPLTYSELFTNIGSIYFIPPWVYNPTLDSISARSNALLLTSLYTNLPGSQLLFDEQWRWEWLLPQYNNLWDILLPKRYRYETILSTSRIDMGYSQTLTHGFSTLSDFPWARYLPISNLYQINPLQLELSLSFSENYLIRIATTTYASTLRQALFFTKDTSISTSYSLQYGSEKRISNWYAFEGLYGFPKNDSSPALKSSLNHTLSCQFNWNIPNLKELKLLFWTINLRGSTLQNSENLSLRWGTTTYDKPFFPSFIEPIYEITYNHSSRYQFTDYITATFILKALNHRYREVLSLNNTRVEKPFEMGWGLYLAFDLGIKF